MKHRLMNKAVTTQDGTDIGMVKNVIINPSQKEIALEVSKGPLRGETAIPWTQIVSIGDRIVLAGEASAGARSTGATSNPQKSTQKDIGSIEVLYYSDCPHYEETLQTILGLLSEEGLSADVRATDLSEGTQPEKLRSSMSSPTVLLNGTDIAPPFDDYYGPRGGHCRIYEYNDEMYPYPPKELIRSALKRQSARSVSPKPQLGEQRAEAVGGKHSEPREQPRSRDYLDSPEALKPSQAERPSEESAPQQTTDSIEERRNRQLEAGMPAERKDAREQRHS